MARQKPDFRTSKISEKDIQQPIRDECYDDRPFNRFP